MKNYSNRPSNSSPAFEVRLLVRATLYLLIVALASSIPAAEPLPEDADKAWEIVEKAMAVKIPALALPGRLPTTAEMEAHQRTKSVAALRCADLADAFATKFPGHRRAAESRNLCREGLNLAVRGGALDQLPRLERIEREILAKSGLSSEQRFQLRAAAVERAAAVAQAKGEDMLSAYEAGVRGLQRDFPGRPELAQMLYAVAVRSSGAKARALAVEVRRSAAAPELKADAGRLIERADRIDQPLRLKFTAVTGEKIDTAAFVGKVVLVNFWATWSAPSISQLPRLVRLGEKFKDDLVLLGVSSDHERKALSAYLNHKAISWPQCFDNDPNTPSLIQSLGVDRIPAIWLIDRHGRLRFTDAALRLEDSLQALLAEPVPAP